MKKFGIHTQVYFGENALAYLEELPGSRIFIVADPFMVKSGMTGQVTKHLEGRECRIFDQVEPDPSLELVTKGVHALLEFGPDAVVALGGGSAIDQAKTMVYFAGRIQEQQKLPLVAVPTTSGTGSEVTSYAVITDRKKGVKYPLADQALLPAAALLDASLTESLPPAVAADTGMDVLTHALEAYVSVRADAFSDAFAEKAVAAVFACLPRCVKEPREQQAREQMHYASCMAGLAFDRAGLGLNHAIAHTLGGKLKIPHGRANAVMLPLVLEFNAQLGSYDQKDFSPAACKYARLARLAGFGGSGVRGGVQALLREIRRLQVQLGLPGDIRGCGVSREEYRLAEEDMARAALSDQCLATNPRAASELEIRELLRKAYEGNAGK